MTVTVSGVQIFYIVLKYMYLKIYINKNFCTKKESLTIDYE